MRLTTLSDNTLLVEQHMHNSKKILRESCDGLTQEQRQIVEGYYNELRPLIEASLTADQIKNIFGAVEKSATDAGGNRTMIGQGKDVLAKANEIIDKAGRWLQDTTPVKAFDQKFEDLKRKINTKFPDSKVLDMISNMGIYAKNNPGKTAAIVGVLTAIASLAGGPVGGAIAGQVLRGAVELLKGEKFSTAIGKGIKTAAFGYLTGKAFDLLGDWVGKFREQSIPFGAEDAGLEKASWNATYSMKAPGFEWTRTTQGFNVLVKPEEASAIRAAMNLVKGGGDGAVEGFDQLRSLADIVRNKEYIADLQSAVDGAWKVAKDNDSLLQFINTAKQGLQASAQGAVAAAGVAGKDKKESVYSVQKPLSEGQVYLVFNRITQLNEGPMDAIKGFAGKAMDKVRTVGTNLTTKITADKLNSAWQKAGSPTDSEELKKFLTGQGIDTAMIDTVYKSLKISSSEASLYSQVKADLAKLDKKGKQRLAAYLQKQLGTS
jgi:hypothetical protein